MTGVRYTRNLLRIALAKLFRGLKSSFTSKLILSRNYPPGSRFNFIQIGAADGISHDFLFDFVTQRQLAGIAIEPIPDLYLKLVDNYSQYPSVIPVNLAVHQSKKILDMYRVDETTLNDLPDWAAGISSIDPLHHKRSGIPSDKIKKIEVKADHLMNIISAFCNTNPIDLLQIDAEGSDLEIIRQIDFQLCNPVIIRFEFINLELTDVNTAIQLLKKQGYHCFYDDFDVLAVDLRRARL